jgi:hypothetical protein
MSYHTSEVTCTRLFASSLRCQNALAAVQYGESYMGISNTTTQTALRELLGPYV